jgi:hypothetical protein
MSSKKASVGLENEIIDDRALESLDDDKLGHALIVNELKSLILAVKTPSTIALYGRWGSGKTSIQRLTATALAGKTGIRVATFNAFKYGELPLRRHFLVQLAAQWKLNAKAYRDRLYLDETENQLHFALPRWLLLVGVPVGFVVAIQAISAGFAAIAASTAHEDLLKAITQSLGTTWVVSFPTAAILALLLSVLGKTLPVTVKRTAPSSAEQFEQLFIQLVETTGEDRLVVLIDELDRCPPAEIANTLEALRTFLDVARCVFVVTADQQALETALTKAVEQSTPVDVANPYYSSGSGYLDKIFSYQIALPPLLPRRLSAFALDLLKDRHGLWDAVDREDVVSILIPTHVSSPRRVKALLNAYALTYRLKTFA